MSWQKYRVAIGAALFVALLIATVFVFKSRNAETPHGGSAEPTPTAPDIDKLAITELEIRRPEGVPVKLTRRGTVWRVVAPVDAAADQAAVESALEKLGDLRSSALLRAAKRTTNVWRWTSSTAST